MSVLSEYLKVYKEYFQKYGEKTAVLMQVGHFYEIYGVDNGKENHGNAEELSRVLNIILTRKNKKVLENSMNNPLMLGFPCLALSKYVPMLLNENYTVVVVDQQPVKSGFKRKVSDVISPSTYIDSSEDDNYLVLVYVDKHKHIGMAAISVLTGNSVVHECYSDPDDIDLPLDDALGFIKKHRPREVVLCTTANCESLVSHLELENVLYQKVEPSSRNVAYQNAILGCAFDTNSMLSNIELIDLERLPYALQAYVLLIEFVHGHNPMLLRRMSKPDRFSNDQHLVLSTSTLDQLNVTSQTKSLFNVLNKCMTKAGKRLLRSRLAVPSADSHELLKRYDQIDEFGTLSSDAVEKLFKRTADLERLQRRLTVGVLSPGELANLVASYDAALELDVLVAETEHIDKMNPSHRQTIVQFVETCRYALDLDEMPTCDAETVAFNTGVFADVDQLKDKLQQERHAINDLLKRVSSFGIEGARIEHLQSVGHCVTISSARAKHIPERSGLILKNNRTIVRITSPEVELANRDVISIDEELRIRTKKRYRRLLDYLSSFSSSFKPVAHFVACVDVTRSNFRVKELYNYCRPNVSHSMQDFVEEHGMRGYCEHDERKSFVDAKDLRHAIMERIDDGNEYIPNDVRLDGSGIVLYSMNSCGKTTLLKALGLSVILAQAGCFVPASNFTIRPFKCIMTRILSRDNIMKGQSSFVAEMSELRAILKRAVDSSTLVLADEITHGTEHTSGSAIFVSSVETLAKRKVNFMFTTHLHSAYPLVRSVPNVRTCHLSVTFSANGTKSITFERKLKDGPGGSVYGLEVCEYLDMDAAFLARAFKIRDDITPDKTEPSMNVKLSPYNRNKAKVKCESCGYRPRSATDQPLHTHHIKEQRRASDEGMIEGLHKDVLSNLMVLCKQCHSKVHAN